MANYDANTIAEFLVADANVVNKAANSLRGIFSLGTNEQRVNILKYMVTYGKSPTYDEAKAIFGKSNLSEDRYKDFMNDAKNALNAVLNDHTYVNDKGESITLTFDNLASTIPQIKKNQELYDAGYDVSVENFNYVTDANGNVVDRNTVDTTNISTNGYGNRDTYNHIVNSIADDIHGLGGDSQQIALVEYYLEHGDLPKDIVDDVIGRETGNTRYNNLVDKIEEAANDYFTKNPDNLSKDVIDSYKQTFNNNKAKTEESYRAYNLQDINDLRSDNDIVSDAIDKFTVLNNNKDKRKLVEYYLTYGELPDDVINKLLGSEDDPKKLSPDRLKTIRTKVMNSVAETIREHDYMPDATNEQIIQSLYKGTQSVRGDRDAGKVVNFGHTATEPTKEENKPLNSTNNGNGSGGNGGNDGNDGNDNGSEGDGGGVDETTVSPSYAEDAYNQYYKDIWSLDPGTAGYSIYTNLANAERNAAQSAMALADAQYQNAAMQQAATVKNITDQVRAERMAKLRAGMNEAQIANQDMQMMMSNINALNEQMNAMNYNTLQAQQQYNLAQDTAYKEYLNQAQAMNQTGAAYYAAQTSDPVTQALEYMNRTGANYNDALTAVTTGTTGTTNSTKK